MEDDVDEVVEDADEEAAASLTSTKMRKSCCKAPREEMASWSLAVSEVEEEVVSVVLLEDVEDALPLPPSNSLDNSPKHLSSAWIFCAGQTPF